MRTAFFWLWFIAAVGALGRLASTGQHGLPARLDPGDAIGAVVLITAFVVLGRVLYRSVRPERS